MVEIAPWSGRFILFAVSFEVSLFVAGTISDEVSDYEVISDEDWLLTATE